MTTKQFDELALEHKVMAELRNSQAEIMSEYKLLEARVRLTDLLIHCINSDDDAELYKQFKDGFLTTTQFVSDIGQGHTTYGRFARERGVNPIHIVAMLMDDQSGDLAWAATRVKIKTTGERLPIIKTDGVTRTLGRQILGPKNTHA